MPTKRRIEKSRRELDTEDYEDHFYGPGTALLNGCGYCGRITGEDRYEKLTDDQRRTVDEAMRADWPRHGRDILAKWAARIDHDLYIARQYHGDPDQPWSMTQFGPPSSHGR